MLLLSVILTLVLSSNGEVTTPYPTPREPPTPYDLNCKDKLDSCSKFGDSACEIKNENWAKENCARTCKFCQGPPVKPPYCEDREDNCESYQNSICTDPRFSDWARVSCRRFCRFCPREILTVLDAMTTTIPTNDCYDKVDCPYYGKGACEGFYESWAHEHCPVYCGFCHVKGNTPAVLPCIDVLDCRNFDLSICHDVANIQWVSQNCRRTCGICTPDTTTPHMNIPTPMPVKTPPSPTVLPKPHHVK